MAIKYAASRRIGMDRLHGPTVKRLDNFSAAREAVPVSAVRGRALNRPVLGVKRTLRGHRQYGVHDPFVWSGRALQENFDELAVSGLASMYPTFDWSVAPCRHGYQRACNLISGQASRWPNGSPVLARAGKTEPPSRLVLSQTSADISSPIDIEPHGPTAVARNCVTLKPAELCPAAPVPSHALSIVPGQV